LREVEIHAWCDACWAADETRTPSAGPWTVGLLAGDDGQRPALKVLDLCEPHGKEVADLLELTHRAGQPPTGARAAAAPVARQPALPLTATREVSCPVCQVGVKRNTLVGHVWKQHRGQRPEFPGRCPECRAEYPTAQGLASHRRLVHDYDALSDALSGVKGYRLTGRERDL